MERSNEPVTPVVLGFQNDGIVNNNVGGIIASSSVMTVVEALLNPE